MGTLTYVARRLLLLVPTLIGITIVTFGLVCLVPGDPATLRAGDVQDPEQSERYVKQLRERFHLDEPVPVRYALWMRGLLTGDLGRSMASGERQVAELIEQALMPTLSVNLIGLSLGFALAIPIGLYAAYKQDGLFDRVAGVLLYGLHSIPSYVGAVVLILFVSVRWDLLPFRGMRSDNFATLSWGGQLLDVVAHGTLYVVCITYGSLAYYSRFVRQNLLEVIRQDYIRTAHAKGLTPAAVVVKHGFRNTLIPFVTLLGLIFPHLIGGSVILETIFTWPGLGRLLVTSMFERDLPVIMALSTASAFLVVVGTLVVDVLYGFVDPRVSHG